MTPPWRAALEQIRNRRQAADMAWYEVGWLVARRGVQYLARRLRGRRVFELDGVRYQHFVHPFILDNERTVEIPIALAAVERHRNGRILEVGHVLSAYTTFPHVILDKYERGQGVLNVDVVDFKPDHPFDLIVSISTIEHVGWDELDRDSTKPIRAIAQMRQWLAPEGELVVTMPLGYNPHVDRAVADRAFDFDRMSFLIRVNRNNLWRAATWEEARQCRFGEPFPCANAIVVGFGRGPRVVASQSKEPST